MEKKIVSLEIPIDIINELFQFLASKPYSEVAQLIGKLQSCKINYEENEQTKN